MGNTIVDQVVVGLQAIGIRADEAYPGGRIPALTGPVAAVRLGKVDRAVRTTAVEVVVMSPAGTGGGICETTALLAVEKLQTMEATCVKDVCRFDEMADVFYIEIEAVFFGTALSNGWSAGPGYDIKIGAQPMPHVTSFSSGRKIEGNQTAIAAATWEFSLEELLPPGTGEPPEVTEPFTVQITRSSGGETFKECTWFSISREETIRGVRQIRKGYAKQRVPMGIL